MLTMVGHTMGTSSAILYAFTLCPVGSRHTIIVHVQLQMLYIVSYLCTIVGVYSCAVDANQCVRALRRVGTLLFSEIGFVADNNPENDTSFPLTE